MRETCGGGPVGQGGSDNPQISQTIRPVQAVARPIIGAAVNFSDQSDPTCNRHFRTFWRCRDPFFRPEAERFLPLPSSIRRTTADGYQAFLDRARAALREVGE